MYLKRLLLLILLPVFLASCGHRKNAKAIERFLEGETGQDYKVVKLWTEQEGFAVLKNKSTGEYVAYNVDKFDKETMKTFEDYKAVLGVNDHIADLTKDREWVESGYLEKEYAYEDYLVEYYDNDCECYRYEYETRSYWTGDYYWVDTSHWYTFYTGGGFRFNSAAGASKDLDTFAALKEATAQKFISYKLKSDFSLSNDRAQELAKLAINYQKLESIRELTISEKNEFSQKALGMSFSDIESSLKKKAEGDTQSYQKLLETASRVNKTTPEQIESFFADYIGE